MVADDHPIWRSGLRADLGSNFHVVGEAGDADEAIALIRSARPDLVVCDLHMPAGGGLKVARERGESVPVVMLTVSEQERDLLDAVAAGAQGYLVKSTGSEELRHQLWRAAHGEPVFSPALASLVLGEFRRLAKASGPVHPLSTREREVLQYVARGQAGRGQVVERLRPSGRDVVDAATALPEPADQQAPSAQRLLPLLDHGDPTAQSMPCSTA